MSKLQFVTSPKVMLSPSDPCRELFNVSYTYPSGDKIDQTDATTRHRLCVYLPRFLSSLVHASPRVDRYLIYTILFCENICRLPANGKTLSPYCTVSVSVNGKGLVSTCEVLVYTAAIKIFLVLRPKFPAFVLTGVALTLGGLMSSAARGTRLSQF